MSGNYTLWMSLLSRRFCNNGWMWAASLDKGFTALAASSSWSHFEKKIQNVFIYFFNICKKVIKLAFNFLMKAKLVIFNQIFRRKKKTLADIVEIISHYIKRVSIYIKQGFLSPPAVTSLWRERHFVRAVSISLKI